MRLRLAQVSRSAARALPGRRAAGALLLALAGAGALFRVRLALSLRTGDTAVGLDAAPTLREALRPLAADALFALAGAGLLLLLARGLGTRAVFGHRAVRAILLTIAAGLLLLLGALCQAHTGVLLATGSGLTIELLRESLTAESLRESLALLTGTDALCVAAGPLLLLLGYLTPARARPLVGGTAGALTAGMLLVGLAAPVVPLPPAVLHHPAGFVLADALHGARAPASLRAATAALLGTGHAARDGTGDATGALGPGAPDPGADPDAQLNGDGDGSDGHDGDGDGDAGPFPASIAGLPPGQPDSLALLPPLFSHEGARPHKTVPATTAPDGRPWNVIVILMESTGLDYALRPAGRHGPEPETASDPVAMPFLRSLGAEGYLLKNHFSTGNSSPRGIASLLGGLYVMPEVGIFDVRKDNYLPSLLTYLDRAPGPRYGRFLVTPASLDWYFPHAMLAHSGLDELWGYHALPVRKNAPGGRAHARDEADTVRFFLQRLDQVAAAPAPFVAIYYSFVAHWPYVDYGPQSHFVPPTRPLHAYYNNLHFLDQQIEIIFNHCKERGILDKTIFVLAGDHGEAFGQHAHNYTHSRASYNENYRTPLVLYQPRLFPPRVFTQPTSHVDVLPTLLDALGVRYEPRLLQGESLFQDRFQRRYIFLYGNEDTISSISEDSIKLQISFKDKSCWVYDLKSDPDEKKRLGCQGHAEQQRALLLYRSHQRGVLRRYSEALRGGRPLGAGTLAHN